MELVLRSHIQKNRPMIETHIIEVHDLNNPPDLFSYLCVAVGLTNLKGEAVFKKHLARMLDLKIGFVTPGLDRYRILISAQAEAGIKDHERIHYFLRGLPDDSYDELLSIINNNYRSIYNCWIDLFDKGLLFVDRHQPSVRQEMREEMLVRTVNKDWYLDLSRKIREQVPPDLLNEFESCKQDLQNRLLQIDTVVLTT